MTTHKTHIYLSVNNILKSKKEGKKILDMTAIARTITLHKPWTVYS